MRFAAALLAALSALPLAATAQTTDTASLRGTLTDPAGLPIAGATVVLAEESSGAERRVQTGGDGSFFAAGLPAGGLMRLRAHASGFADLQAAPLHLEPGTTAQVSLRLGVAGAASHVEVSGALDTARADQPQLGDQLSSTQMRSTPLLNRRLTYLPLLLAANRPAINQGDVFMNQLLFTANGTGRRQTWFAVDGTGANDSWGRQTIFTNVPLDAVGEMSVLDNAFAAEYGFAEGAVVNLVTRSGSAQWHGDALALWRPSSTEAHLAGFSAGNATSGNDITSDTLVQGAATLSGPLTHAARTTFLGSAEASWQDRASPVTSPVAPGNFIGHYRDWLGFLRLDHALGADHQTFARLNSDVFYDTNPNGIVGGNTLPSVARVFHRRTFTAEAGDTVTLSPHVLNAARMQFQLASPITQFSPVLDSTQVQVPLSSGGTFTSGTSQSALLMNRQWNVVENLIATRGVHEWHVGFDVLHARNGGNSKEFGGPIYLGELLYKACTGTAAFCESPAYLDEIGNVQSYTQSYGDADYLIDDTLAAVFVTDNARVTPDLTLNLGARYELQTFTDARRDVAPRVGLAYDVGGRGRTTVRAGFGLYFAQVVDNEQADYALTGPTGVFNYTATAGQVGFPASVADVPLPSFPAGAVVPLRSLYLRPGRAAYYNQFLPTSTLVGYPGALLNPYNEQWTLAVDQQLATHWVLTADYLGAHTLRIVRPVDVDPPSSFVRTAPNQVRSPQAANCTRPLWAAFYAARGGACDPVANAGAIPAYSVVQSDTNDGVAYYQALDVNLSHHAANGSALLASYTLSHTLDTVDPDVPTQNPNDPRATGVAELGPAIFDQRHRLVLSGVWVVSPLGVQLGGVASLASGLPFNVVTGVTNSGDTGATTDRPVIDGAVVARDTGRGTALYDVEPFVGKRVALVPEHLHANLRAEAFNVLNHRNVVGFSGTWGNGATPGQGFGAPLAGATNQLPARELQFSAQLEF